MKMLIQLLLASCLAVGLYASVENQDTDQPMEIIQSDMIESYYGVEDVSAVLVNSAPEAPEEAVAAGSTPETPRGRGRGRHGGRGGHRGDRGHRGHHRPSGNWTAQQKMDHVCSAIQSPEMSRKERWIQAKLNRLAPETRDRLATLLAARKAEMLQCCQSTGPARVECGERMRRERYDRVCAQEEPLCIWAAIKGSSDTRSSPDTVSTCCSSTGQPRYDCFDAARRSYVGQRWRRRI